MSTSVTSNPLSLLAPRADASRAAGLKAGSDFAVELERVVDAAQRNSIPHRPSARDTLSSTASNETRPPKDEDEGTSDGDRLEGREDVGPLQNPTKTDSGAGNNTEDDGDSVEISETAKEQAQPEGDAEAGDSPEGQASNKPAATELPLEPHGGEVAGDAAGAEEAPPTPEVAATAETQQTEQELLDGEPRPDDSGQSTSDSEAEIAGAPLIEESKLRSARQKDRGDSAPPEVSETTALDADAASGQVTVASQRVVTAKVNAASDRPAESGDKNAAAAVAGANTTPSDQQATAAPPPDLEAPQAAIESADVGDGSREAAGGDRSDRTPPPASSTQSLLLRTARAETQLAEVAPTGADNPRVDSERFIGRVSRAFQVAEQRGGTVQLRLSPPELGAMKIELSVQQGTLTAKLETETAAAKNVLLDNLPALRERLAAQEIRVDKFEVDVRQHDTGGQPDWQAQEREGRAPHRGGPRTNGRSPSAETATNEDEIRNTVPRPARYDGEFNAVA